MQDDETTNTGPSDESLQLRKEVERLSAENLLLRQRTELEHLWAEDREKQSQAFSQHKKDVDAEINKRLVGLSLVGLVVVGLGWWSVSRPIRQSVQDRLDKEFASENIQRLISDAALKAAQSQTKAMMEGTLRPAVDQAMKQIQQQRDQVTEFTQQFRQESGRSMGRIRTEMGEEREQERQSLNALREEYTKQISELRPLVELQEKLKEIDLLKSSAIGGDFVAFNKLVSYKTNDKDLATAALNAVIEVKEPYLVGMRTQGTSIWIKNPDGTQGVTDANIPSASLIALFLFTAPEWTSRAKAAELLASKRETGVAEALLRSMQNDSNLVVRRASLQSFSALTGFRQFDVFDFGRASEWWEKNKTDYLKTISK
jgi:hypothetical protein